MNAQNWMVVFRGELKPGVEAGRARASLRAACKLSEERVEQIFSVPAVVLKKGCDEATATRFQQQLARIGLVTQVEAETATRVVSESTVERAQNTDTDTEGANHSERLPFEFHGSGGEYFKIWIVNILLSILTLGIYSAWAKVRNHRYFYSNTRVGDVSFEYTADPVAILKGRIVAVLFLVLFNMVGAVLPLLNILFILFFIAIFPWLVNRALGFRNRNTAYRNLRFGFDGEYMDAAKAFVLWPIAGVLTLGILMPYAFYKQKHFIVNNSRYGTSPFTAEFSAGDVYGIALRVFLIVLAAGVLGAAGTLLGPLAPFTTLLVMVLYLVAFAFFTANTQNLIYNGSALQEHRFDSSLMTGRLAMIYITNWLLLLFTLGLAMPWAKVRLARYRAESMVLLPQGSLDKFIAAEEKQVNSLAEEVGEAFDMDIGL